MPNILYKKLNEKLNALANKINVETKSSSCSIYLFNRNKSKLILRGVSGAISKNLNQDSYNKNEGLTSHIANNNLILNLEDASDFSEIFIGKHRKNKGPFLGFPIIIKEFLCLGTIKIIRDNSSDVYTNDEEKILQNYSKKISTNIIEVNRYALSHFIHEKYDVLTTYKSGYLSLFNDSISKKIEFNNLLDYALYELASNVGCRSVSVFTFNKEGKLERRKQLWFSRIKDKENNKAISKLINERNKEVYSLEEKLLLTSSVLADESKGRIFYSNEIEKDNHFKSNFNVRQSVKLYNELLSKYLKSSEKIQNIVVIPLKSSNRTYGAVRFMNKLDFNDNLAYGFTHSDIGWAESLTNSISSNILRVKELSKYNVIRDLNRVLRNNNNFKNQYDIISNKITSSLTSYSCCVIRRLSKDGRYLELEGINDSVLNNPSKITINNLSPNEQKGILYSIIVSKKPKYVPDLLNYKHSHIVNKNWILENNFKSAYFLPIIAEGENVVPYGTISIYTKFKFKFSNKHRENLLELSEQISNLMSKEEYMRQQLDIKDFGKNLEEQVERYLNRYNDSYNKNLNAFHIEELNRLFKIALIEAQKITHVDQLVILRKTSNTQEYSIAKSLEYKQDNKFLLLPNELQNEVAINGSYLFKSSDHRNNPIMKNQYLKEVREIIFFELKTTINHYLGIKGKNSKYYLAYILLNEPDTLTKRERRESRQKISNLREDYIVIYEFLCEEISKAIHNLNRYHDVKFINNIVDDILQARDVFKTFHNLLNEIRFRSRFIDDVVIIFNSEFYRLSRNIISSNDTINKKIKEKKDLNSFLNSNSIDEDKVIENLEKLFGLKANYSHVILLQYETKNVGYLIIFSSDIKQFSSSNKYLFKSIADQIVIGLINRKLNETNLELNTKLETSYAKENSFNEYLESVGESIDNFYEDSNFPDFIGSSLLMKMVKCNITQYAKDNKSVLIIGETGTGKELVAKYLHKLSGKQQNTFFDIDCGSIDNELFVSEIFGHNKGAFTGALDHIGLFEKAANGGTIFLDEIGNLSLENQKKLLRAIQEKKFRRVGSNRDIVFNAKIISATNLTLAELNDEKNFRQDLLARIAQRQVSLPNLKKRHEDIEDLSYFLLRNSKEFSNYHFEIKPNALKKIKTIPLTKNIRSLDNILYAAANLIIQVNSRKKIKTKLLQISEKEIEFAFQNSVESTLDINQNDKEQIEHNPKAFNITKYKSKTSPRAVTIEKLLQDIEVALSELEATNKKKTDTNISEILKKNRTNIGNMLRYKDDKGYKILSELVKKSPSFYKYTLQLIADNAYRKNWLYKVYEILNKDNFYS